MIIKRGGIKREMARKVGLEAKIGRKNIIDILHKMFYCLI